jgi:hypothetical protein
MPKRYVALTFFAAMLLVSAGAWRAHAFANLDGFRDPISLASITGQGGNLQISEVSAYGSIKSDRRKLRRRLRQKRCSLAKTGSLAAQRTCVKQRLAVLDPDKDGISVKRDNCPEDINNEQEDTDTDTLGDLCDNCPAVANETQTDTDTDTVGDACDNCPAVANESQTDTDTDTVGDACDNCPAIANTNQADADSDGTGDACEDVDPSL